MILSAMSSAARVLGWIACIVLANRAANSEELLTRFQPSSITDTHGKVSEVEFSTPFIELEPGWLAHHVPHAMKNFRFAEPVWVIGYKSEVLGADGKYPKENYLCHTFFADQRMSQKDDDEFKGVYSDAFTPELRLPDGFGIPFSPEARLHWMPMFNNRGDESVRVKMKVVVTLIRASDLVKPLQPLYGNLRSVHVPHLFFVPPGKDERQTQFVAPFNGKIHFLGTHLHPHGISIELYNESRREQVWKGTRKRDADSPMNVYSKVEGYPIRSGETYRIIAIYQNATQEKIDAMAGLFMLYSRD